MLQALAFLVVILVRYVIQINRDSIKYQCYESKIPRFDAVREKLLIVYNFHWKNSNSLAFIQQHLVPWFKWNFKRDVDVVFYGPAENGIIRANDMPEGGHRSYMSLISAYEDFPTGYYGYLQMNDDSFVNPFVLMHHDFMRPLCEGAGGVNLNHAPVWINLQNENGDTRWQAVNQWIKKVCRMTNNSFEMCQHPVERIPAGYADFFYIPKMLMPAIKFLFTECLREDVFLEFCVPASIANFDYSVIPRCWGLDDFTSRTCGHLHPIKLSKKRHIKTMKKWLKRYEREDYFRNDLKPNIIKQLKRGWNCDGFGVW